jgi:hypothetical protein
VVGDCYVARSLAHAVVLVRNEGTGAAQTYTVTVHLGPSGPVSLEQQVQVSSAPGQIGTATVNAPATGAPDAKLPCDIVSIKDGSGATPTLVAALPPPPDTRPSPAITTPSATPRTSAPATSAPATSAAPTTAAPSTAPRTSAPATTAAPTSAPPTTAPRTTAPRTSSVPRPSSLPTDDPFPDPS